MRGALALVLGALLTGSGAGVGPPRAGSGYLDVVAVLGFTALAGGVALVGLGAAASRDVVAVVAEGVTGRSTDDLGWLSTAYGWRGTVTRTLHAAQTCLADLLSGARRPTPLADAVRDAAPRPILLIAAGQVVDEQHAVRALQAAAPRSVDVWVVLGARHTGGLTTAPQDWESRVVDFLDAALGGLGEP